MSEIRRIWKQFCQNLVVIIITAKSCPVKKKSCGGYCRRKRIYFLRKDMQSVHWSMVGLASWVPT